LIVATIVKGKNPNKPYTVRYYHGGKQRERSFVTRREAKDWIVKFEHDSRAQAFVDPKVAGEKFAAVAQRWLARHPGSPLTLVNYEKALRLHVLPVFGSTPLVRVSQDREGVERFLRETLPAKGLGASMVRMCGMVISAIVNDAIKAGRLTQAQNRLRGITLPPVTQKADLVFASREQIDKLAAGMPEPYGFTVYLMRGCGLRLGEALGVRRDDMRNGTLRLARQTNPVGYPVPLKHRAADDYRDIPVPDYVLDRRPADFMRNDSLPPVAHRTYQTWFTRARDAAGLPKGFTPHSLRHIFASVCLAGGVPITDVSKWLGHRNIQTTYGIYGHLVPASWEKARQVLDKDWQGDSQPTEP
jgi:integrase